MNAPQQADQVPTPQDESVLVAARRAKLDVLRGKLNVEPYGSRQMDLVSLDHARNAFDKKAQADHDASVTARKTDPAHPLTDARQRMRVAGRVIQHRDLGKIVFFWLRDSSGDLQVSVSKAGVSQADFELAKLLDYGDIAVAEGPVGCTNKGEICVWAQALQIASKSLTPPPGKWHGLEDAEIRYRKRYVDMYSTPETMRVFEQRSRIVSMMRRFMEARGFLEVETPMMQPIAGGAAARPFVTHHNTLDLDLYLRVAPELYLKRLLVGGMRKVYEINRNFRNEGVDRSHNPEFTSMEAYEAFGDYMTMLDLVEGLVHHCAAAVAGVAGDVSLPYGKLNIDYSRPFARVRYEELFTKSFGFDMRDEAKARAAARALHMDNADTLDHWLLVNELFERKAEHLIDPQKPTFVLDYPSAISPLTRPSRTQPEIAERWDLFIGGMEIGPAYTELNDPDIQLSKFTEQLKGADVDENTFRSLDMDFVESLRVGMPPAGGMGLGVDRLVMLLTNSQSIRDVILFPLMRPE